MNMKKKEKKLYLQEKKRYLKKIVGTIDKPRLSIFRSHSHIYAQLIDDTRACTLTSCSTLEKKNLTAEIKVAQFSGYTSKESGYHHGEASLNAAIVGMAQNFVGSNNINLLLPNGQFGTRLQGGKDSASERYIFTQLNKITRSIFPASDDNILNYLNDDGLSVEPVFYAPIIPMVLINGSKGIGTGFSTDIMCFNPLQIIQYLKNKLLSIEEDMEFIPYYEGFQGLITKISDDKFLIKGVYEKLGNDKIRVTELPVGYWTEDFKELLEEIIDLLDPIDFTS